MNDPVIFYTGLFCFIMVIFGVVLTVQEFNNIKMKEKLKAKRR